MPIAILMPALSPTMTSGTLARWLVQEGETIQSGNVLAEIETDKATMEVEAVDEGTLAKILIGDNSANVTVNTPIAVILEEDEDAADVDTFIASLSVNATSPTAAAEPVADAPAKENTTKPAVNAPTSAAAQTPLAAKTSSRVFSSPLARRIAADKGIDLAQVTGSGPHGRIIRIDVENFTPTAQAPTVAAPATLDSNEDPTFERVPLSGMRKVIAERLSYSKQSIPHFYLSAECNIDTMLALRSQMNEGADKAGKISVNDLIIKACAVGLMRQPKANACFDNDAIKYFTHTDIAVAVSIPNGLITPLVRRADLLSLGQIATKTKDLATRARDGKLAPHEYQGGSFTISNLGMFGVDQFSAVINPPHACILAVGRGRRMPVVDDQGNVNVATQMNITLSVDHRAVDGAMAAALLSELKNLIENPIKMLI